MVNTIRFSGLASGMDTQSMVEAMIKVDRIPLDKIKQKKQQIEWKRDDYRDMNLLLKELDDKIFNTVYRKANLTTKTVSSTNSSIVTATANADAGNVNFTIENVTLATAARKQSAQSVSNSSADQIDANKSIWSQRNKIGKINETVNVTGNTISLSNDLALTDGEATIEINGQEYSVTTDTSNNEGKILYDQENKTLTIPDGINLPESDEDTVSYQISIPWEKETVTDKFTVPKDGGTDFQLKRGAFTLELTDENGSTTSVESIKVGDKDYKIVTDESQLDTDSVFIDESTGKIKFGEKLTGEQTFEISYTNHYLEFAVQTYDESGQPQYKKLKINGDTSLNNMFSTINNSNTGISMFYDPGSDKVVASRTETGNFNQNGDEFSFFAVSTDEEGNVTYETEHSFFTSVLGLGKDIDGTGTDAQFTLNGLETTRKSNNFTLNGVSFNLNKNTAPGESATINIQTDTEAIMETIKDFVDKYNEVIEKINGKLQEERHRDYQPLTDEEREALSDKEIEKWEELAKSGMLRRDPLLTSALDKLRFNFYGEVTANENTLANPKYNQIAEIGITTSKNFMDRGKLEIDEDKLRKAIEDDPNAIYHFFMADGETEGEKGIARRLRSTIDSTIKSIEERAGNSFKTAHSYTLGRQLLDFDDQIQRYEQRLSAAENRYWNQFNAMEKALQELNNQSNMLYSYLGMGAQG